MMARRPRKLPPVRTWVEVIDGEFVVGCAMMCEVRRKRGWVDNRYGVRRWLYGLSCFVLVPNGSGHRWRAVEAATERLGEIAAARGNQLERIGLADGIEDNP